MRPKAEWAIGFLKFVLGVRRQQDLYLHLHLLKIYIFTAHFEIRKLIFVGYVMYSWIVTLATRFSFWHKIYLLKNTTRKLNSYFGANLYTFLVMAYLRKPDVYLYLRSLHKPTVKSRNATSVLSTPMGANGDVTFHNIIKVAFKSLKIWAFNGPCSRYPTYLHAL